MPRLQCPKCKRVSEHSSFQGRWWHPIWTARCDAPCWAEIVYDVGAGQIDPAEMEALMAEEKARRKLAEKQRWFRLSEFWLQLFVRENPGSAGLRNLNGPRQSGPDFLGANMLQEGGIEVERRWDDYLRHRHHVNKKYANTHSLVVLCADRPLEPLRPLLPRQIIYFGLDEFRRWYRKSRRRFAREVSDLCQGIFPEAMASHGSYLR